MSLSVLGSVTSRSTGLALGGQSEGHGGRLSSPARLIPAPTPGTLGPVTDWHLYLVRTSGGALYTGITTDVERRFAAHADGRGSKYLRPRGPLELVYRVMIGKRSVALRAEVAMKKLVKRAKESIVAEQPDREKLLATLAVETSGSRRSAEIDIDDPEEERP
jgi:putative endonuclease